MDHSNHDNNSQEHLHNHKPTSSMTQDELADAMGFTINAANDELCDALFSAQFTEHLEGALHHVIQGKLPKADALMLYRFGNKTGGWSETVGAPVSADNFTFIQREGTPKDILVKKEFPKFFLSVQIEQDLTVPNCYIIKPYHIQIPATTSMMMDGLIYAKEITSVEELSAVEQSFS